MNPDNGRGFCFIFASDHADIIIGNLFGFREQRSGERIRPLSFSRHAGPLNQALMASCASNTEPTVTDASLETYAR